MKCFTHRESEAVDICSNCGKGVCEDCKISLANQTFCKNCAEEHFNEIKNTKPRSQDFNKQIVSDKGLSLGESIIFIIFNPILPIIGYLVWHDSKPKKSKDSITMIPIGFFVWFVGGLILVLLLQLGSLSS